MSRDAGLIGRARDGDPEAFAELARAYAGDLYGAAHLFLGEDSEAGEATREALLRAWRGIGSLRDPDGFRDWLLRIGMIEARRRAGGEARAETAVGAPGSREELERAVRGLEAGQREALILHDVAGLPTLRAAAAMGIGEAPFRSRLQRARLAVGHAAEGLGTEGTGGEGPDDGGWLERRRARREHRWARARISAYLDGELSEGDRERLEEHAAGCAECGSDLAALRHALRELRRLGEERQAPAGLVDAVVGRLRGGV